MRRLSHLNALRAFEAAAHDGSYVRAAGELGVTPAAVDDLAAGRLVRPFAPMPCLVGWTYYVVHTQDAPGQSKVATFRAWLLKEAGQAA